jgi:tRNA/tmRNA/rRNA uracil-C5-methylase (TrmA/RlmC/RlmD family)
LDKEATALDLGMYDQITGKISDISNIPYQNITYKYINQLGKQWIRKYTLAIAKEMLGYVRTKYTSIPYGDGELTMNGADLIAAAGSEKEALLAELKETLESMSIEAQLEKKVSIADSLNKQLAYVPLKIYMR